MKKYLHTFLLLFSFFPAINAQTIVFLGLANKHITSLKIGEGIIAIGTNGSGVYWQNINTLSDTGWNEIELDGVNIRTVYPHKSGPLGWAIGIGAQPNVNDNEFIYCSYLGGIPNPISYGIDTNYTTEISGLDGFPDPTVCGETFALGGRKLYRRFYTDTTWHSVYNLTIEGQFASIKAREEFGDVYAGGGEGFAGILLIRSTDKGTSWEELFPLIYVTDIDFWGDDEQKVFVTDGMKILRSLDSGENWDNVFQTDSLLIRRISFNSDGNKIIALTNTLFYALPRTYLFYSENNGADWNKITLPIFDLVVGMGIDSYNKIFIATISSGIYKIPSTILDIPDGDLESVPGSFYLYQNYPNPFNASTKISFTIPANQNPLPGGQPGRQAGAGGGSTPIKLIVYDVLGKEVATLMNEESALGGSGKYEVEFNASDLSSGVYFYRLRAWKFVDTKKLLLIK